MLRHQAARAVQGVARPEHWKAYGVCTTGAMGTQGDIADRPIGHLATGGSDGVLGHIFPLSASFSLSF